MSESRIIKWAIPLVQVFHALARRIGHYGEIIYQNQWKFNFRMCSGRSGCMHMMEGLRPIVWDDTGKSVIKGSDMLIWLRSVPKMKPAPCVPPTGCLLLDTTGARGPRGTEDFSPISLLLVNGIWHAIVYIIGPSSIVTPLIYLN